MSDDLEVIPQKTNAVVAIEQSRAIQEVQGMIISAKRFPRDTNAAYTKIIGHCQRLSLANRALYRYPRAGEIISGPSIRLAEVLANAWGNTDAGVTELERRNQVSVAQSYCWDMENNTRMTKTFEVPHEVTLKNKQKKILTDSRDIYEHVANYGARRLRACILAIIPSDIVEAAVKEVKATIAKGGGEPLEDRIRNCLLSFKELGVSQEMLEARLGHAMALTTKEEIVDLVGIYNSIEDGQAKRGAFFDFPDDDHAESRAAALKAKLAEDKK